MAEVFGVVAGVAGILEIGSRVSTKLRKVRRDWANASDDLITLQNDLADLEVVFRTTEDVWKKVNQIAHHDDLASSLQRSAKKANAILQSLEDFVDDMATKTEAQRKRAWVRRKTSVDAKRAELAELRAKMREALRFCESGIITRTQFEVCQLRSSMDLKLQVLFEQHNAILSRLPTIETTSKADPNPEPSNTASESDAMWTVELLGDTATHEATLTPSSTVSIFGLYRNTDSHCEDGCTCWCHFAADQRSQWRTPRMLRKIVGMWMASYNASATWSRECNTATCRRQASTSYQIQYEFPLWFAAGTVQALIQRRLSQLPTLFLKLQSPLLASCHATVVSEILFNDYLRQHSDSLTTRLLSEHGAWPLLILGPRASYRVPIWIETLLRAGDSIYDADEHGISTAQRIAACSIDGTYGRELSIKIATQFPLARMVEDLDLSTITKIILGIQAGDVRSYLSQLPPRKLGMNDLDGGGKSPLHWAAKQGDCYAVEQLILHGADPNIQSFTKSTPLMALARSSTSAQETKFECAKLLIAAGADITRKDVNGLTAFFYACQSPNTAALVELIFDHDITDLYETDRDGYLAYSTVMDPGVIDYLLTKDLDIDFCDRRGRSSLLNAVRNQNLGSTKILLERGANHTKVDSSGLTILHLAAKGADCATMDFLADWGLPGVDPDALGWVRDQCTAEDYFHQRDWRSSAELAAFGRLLRRVRETWNARRFVEDRGENEGGVVSSEREDSTDVSHGDGMSESDSEAAFEDTIESFGDEDNPGEGRRGSDQASVTLVPRDAWVSSGGETQRLCMGM